MVPFPSCREPSQRASAVRTGMSFPSLSRLRRAAFLPLAPAVKRNFGPSPRFLSSGSHAASEEREIEEGGDGELALRVRARGRTVGLTIVTALIGLGLGVGAVVLVRDGDGRTHRGAQPSVVRFRFPAGGAGTGVAVADDSPHVTEPTSGPDAVQAFLTAERDGRADLAYDLLTHASQEEFGSPAAFVDAQADRPQPVGFRVVGGAAGADGDDVTLDVR